MISARRLADYLKEQSLPLDKVELQIATLTLDAVLSVDKPEPRTDLFRYPVPLLSEDGTCSLIDELAAEPHDLSPLFGGETIEARSALNDLHALLGSTNSRVGADWLGIYRVIGSKGQARLVKMAYQGAPSRAEFPLTESFAAGSNNSRVGLTGWGVVIDDIVAWRDMGGSYYECDPKVRSEVCLPVLDEEGVVLGIIDAESSETGFFTPERQVWLAALALVLAAPLAGLPFVEEN